MPSKLNLEELGIFIQEATKNKKNKLKHVLWSMFENDLGTSAEIAKKNPNLQKEIEKVNKIYNKIKPHLLEINVILKKVAKKSPKY